MNKLDKYILQNIIEFLPNYDIFHVETINKYYNNLFIDEILFKKIKYRYHPFAFNIYDNICYKCNLNLILLSDDIDIIHCGHH